MQRVQVRLLSWQARAARLQAQAQSGVVVVLFCVLQAVQVKAGGLKFLHRQLVPVVAVACLQTGVDTRCTGTASPTPEATYSIQAVTAVPATTPAATVKSTPAATAKPTPAATAVATPAATTAATPTPAATTSAVAASPSPSVIPATPLPGGIAVTGNSGISTDSPVAVQTPAAADITRTALDAVLRLVGPNVPPFTPDEQVRPGRFRPGACALPGTSTPQHTLRQPVYSTLRPAHTLCIIC